ncbi:aminoglycoside phosphotransferase family protein [Deinococcus sonorensis]|uniref:Aminoglycoside phosphotransferase family protein n=2 Tax=Deinococcus sonorensis TaxID=309891 RepID=A0AAU7U8Z8_9DEIO
MSAEPPLPHAALQQGLQTHYGLTVDRFEFLPHGTAPAYRAQGQSGTFFVKVLPGTPFWAEARQRVRAELPLLQALQAAVLQVQVPVPTLTGAAVGHTGGFTLAVHRWIEGVPLGQDWAAAQSELAALLGRLHALTPVLQASVSGWPVPPEDFGLPFADTLAADLQRVWMARPHDRPVVVALRALLHPHRAELRRLLAQARRFQQAARAATWPFVACHTDAHGGNVMRDEVGALWLIDWETARLAPAEHDLWMLEDMLPEVLPVYQAAAGHAFVPSPVLTGFYLCRRTLEDLAVDLQQLLHDPLSPEQDAAVLDVLTRFIVPALRQRRDVLERLEGQAGLA